MLEFAFVVWVITSSQSFQGTYLHEANMHMCDDKKKKKKLSTKVTVVIIIKMIQINYY